MEFKPLRRSSLYHEIVDQIEDLIMGEKLLPGDRLPTERELADMFGVSRTTVRQALAALEAKGLIESHIGSGTYARLHSTEFAVARLAHMLDSERMRLAEALEVRSLLEPAVARLAAERATAEDLASIQQQLHEMEQAVETGGEVLDKDSAFHYAIGRAAQNRIVRTILEVIHEAIRESRRLSLATPQGTQVSLADHREIYAALAARDGEKAAAAMAAHMRHVQELAAAELDKIAQRK